MRENLAEVRKERAVLAWRDIAVRYKQAVIGVASAVIRLIFTMIIFTVIFGHLAGRSSEAEAPHMLMVLAGTLPWFLYSTALLENLSALSGEMVLKRMCTEDRLNW